MTATVDQLPAKMRANVRVEHVQDRVPGPCWTWIAGRTAGGYGQVGIGGKQLYVHRVSHTIFIGPIPDGLQTDHLCRNRACCNPAHLEAVTPQVNVLRGEIGQKTECVNEHPLSGDNLARWRGGSHSPHAHRRCRTCFNESHQRTVERHGEKWKATRRAKYQQEHPPSTCCRSGHEWSESNTRITPAGYRLCRQCERDRKRRWREGTTKGQELAA